MAGYPQESYGPASVPYQGGPYASQNVGMYGPAYSASLVYTPVLSVQTPPSSYVETYSGPFPPDLITPGQPIGSVGTYNNGGLPNVTGY